MARYLRFAAAGFFALLAVALIGWWVRSYSKLDELSGPVGDKRGATFFSSLGVVSVIDLKTDPPTWPSSWRLATLHVDSAKYRWFRLKQGLLGLSYKASSGVTEVGLPHWFLAALSFGLAALAYPRQFWRFTVRTLLIATTLVAAVLGMGVYLL